MKMKNVTDAPMSGIAKMYRGITVPLRLLPDFLIIGTQRGGTTSHYKFEVEHRQETLSFEDALAFEEERTRKEREKILADEKYVSVAHSRYSYLVRGIYVDQLEAWMKFFPREQFLILKSEAFYTD